MCIDFPFVSFVQFEVLASLCSISYDVIQQLLINIDDYQLVNVHLIAHDQLEIEVKESISVLRNRSVMENSNNLAHHRMVTRCNGFATAYNLNGGIMSIYAGKYYLFHYANAYRREHLTNCRMRNQIIPAGFYDDSYRRDQIFSFFIDVPIEYDSSGSVDGFFGDCTPVDAVLSSTLDCLYDSSCLQLLFDYFPSLHQVSFYFPLCHDHDTSPSSSVTLGLAKFNATWIFRQQVG
jgi:hypothetical protein